MAAIETIRREGKRIGSQVLYRPDVPERAYYRCTVFTIVEIKKKGKIQVQCNMMPDMFITDWHWKFMLDPYGYESDEAHLRRTGEKSDRQKGAEFVRIMKFYTDCEEAQTKYSPEIPEGK